MNFFKHAILFGIACLFSITAVLPFRAQALTSSPIRFEVSQDPGTTGNYVVKLYNEQKQSLFLYTDFQNFESSEDETGAPRFIGSRDGLASWMSGPETVSIGPGETKEVPIQIRVPEATDPGGYFASIFFNQRPRTVENEASSIGLGTELGVLMLLRVNGDLDQKAGILEFATKGKKRIFTELPIEYYFRFQNSGADRVKPLGDIIIRNTFWMITKSIEVNPEKGNVLPASIRRFESAWVDAGRPRQQEPVFEVVYPKNETFFDHVKYQLSNFAFGFYSAKLGLAYGNSSDTVASASYTIFIFPWQLMVIAIPTIVILLWLLKRLIGRYNRYVINRATARPASSPRRRKK